VKVRLPIFLPLVAAGLVFCAEAAAQTVTAKFSTTITSRQDRGQLDPKTINYQDCIANDSLGLTLTGVSGLTSGHFDIYASQNGQNCASSSVRNTAPNDCWHVAEIPLNASGDTTALTANVRTQDIVGHVNIDTGMGTAANCDGTSAQLQGVTLQLTSQTDAAQNMNPVDSLVLKVDTWRPDPPTNLSAEGGDKALLLSWTVSESTDVLNYRIYCELAGANMDQTGDTAGGATGDATTCTAPDLASGANPEDPNASLEAYRRGSDLGAMATSGTAENLGQNDVLFACGVSAIDKNLNVGNLSELVCGTPVPTAGYYQLYRDAGGNAGGSYCSFGRAPASSGATLVLPFAALGLLVRRFRDGRRTTLKQVARGGR